MKIHRAALLGAMAMAVTACTTNTAYDIPGSYSKYIGGGPGVSRQPPSLPTSTLPPQPTSPTTASTVAAPPFNGITATATLPAPSNGQATTIATASGASPSAVGASNVPALTTTSTTSVSTVYSYTSATSSNTVQYPGGSTLTVNVPASAGPTTGTYYLAVNAPGAGWIYDVAAANANNGTLTFTIPQGLTLNAGQTYVIALYQH